VPTPARPSPPRTRLARSLPHTRRSPNWVVFACNDEGVLAPRTPLATAGAKPENIIAVGLGAYEACKPWAAASPSASGRALHLGPRCRQDRRHRAQRCRRQRQGAGRRLVCTHFDRRCIQLQDRDGPISLANSRAARSHLPGGWQAAVRGHQTRAPISSTLLTFRLRSWTRPRSWAPMRRSSTPSSTRTWA